MGIQKPQEMERLNSLRALSHQKKELVVLVLTRVNEDAGVPMVDICRVLAVYKAAKAVSLFVCYSCVHQQPALNGSKSAACAVRRYCNDDHKKH